MNSILQPPDTSQQGANISVASVTFTAIAAGSGALTVDILGMAQEDGTSVSGAAAVAAAGTVSTLVMPQTHKLACITQQLTSYSDRQETCWSVYNCHQCVVE